MVRTSAPSRPSGRRFASTVHRGASAPGPEQAAAARDASLAAREAASCSVKPSAASVA